MAYYVMNNSLVFCTFLDATKAFDRIRYCKLFRLLNKRGIPPCIIRVLLCFYTSNLFRVAWNGVMSYYFLATNGVKQGGVLSPVIFTLYIDGLLVRLAKANVGCYVGICSFSVGGKAIEFVDFFTHLGHVISSDLDDCRYVANRRVVL